MFKNEFIIKKYKASSPGIRNKVSIKDYTITNNPVNFFNRPLKRSKYCNSTGNLVNYHRKFGNKKLYRLVDFKRTFYNFPAKIVSFEWDPNRTSLLALIQYENGTYSYILKNETMAVGDIIFSYEDKPEKISIGSKMKLKYIPVGTIISNISSNNNNNRGVFLRSAGSFGRLLSKKNGFCMVLFNSGEKKTFFEECSATIGVISCGYNKFKKLGKAGVKHWIGRRSRVRGVAMNPVDHPHGGGNGKTSGGRPSVSRWGKYAKSVVKKVDRRI